MLWARNFYTDIGVSFSMHTSSFSSILSLLAEPIGSSFKSSLSAGYWKFETEVCSPKQFLGPSICGDSFVLFVFIIGDFEVVFLSCFLPV